LKSVHIVGLCCIIISQCTVQKKKTISQMIVTRLHIEKQIWYRKLALKLERTGKIISVDFCTYTNNIVRLHTVFMPLAQ